MTWMSLTLMDPAETVESLGECPVSESLTSRTGLDCEWPGEDLRGLARGALDRWVRLYQQPTEPVVTSLSVAILAGLWSASSSRQREGVFLAPQVFPLPDGGIQLEWHAADQHLEVSIEADGMVGLYLNLGGERLDVEIAPTRAPIPKAFVVALSQISDAVWAAHPTR